MSDEKHYWLAHCRGPNFDQLKRKGFLTFYPTVDDYVFLEVKEENKRLTRQQAELGVLFLRANNALVEVNEDEVLKMSGKTVDQIKLGAEIKVLIGPCENLEGRVVEVNTEGKYICELKGWNRTYLKSLNREEIVLKNRAPDKLPEEDTLDGSLGPME